MRHRRSDASGGNDSPMIPIDPQVTQLGRYPVRRGESTVSGLSSGAFMAVQLHVAHSASFGGAGVIAGGPFRCAETFRPPGTLAGDAQVQNALYICMSPLVPAAGPDAAMLWELARDAEARRDIDPLGNLQDDRVYVFSGTRDRVVAPSVVEQTAAFYRRAGVAPGALAHVADVPAGHAIIAMNPEDPPLDANQPPYINRGDFIQAHTILRHLYPGLAPPSPRLTGTLSRFDQTEFLCDAGDPPATRELDRRRSSMSPFGYLYVPRSVAEGRPARVHVVLHGCKQGYNYVDFVNGRPDTLNSPPYGLRYIACTGYLEIADANDLILLFPQAQGLDDGYQNPDGCWDWWGYTSVDPAQPDYYKRSAVQIRAIHRMLERLGG